MKNDTKHPDGFQWIQCLAKVFSSMQLGSRSTSCDHFTSQTLKTMKFTWTSHLNFKLLTLFNVLDWLFQLECFLFDFQKVPDSQIGQM